MLKGVIIGKTCQLSKQKYIVLPTNKKGAAQTKALSLYTRLMAGPPKEVEGKMGPI